MKLFLADNLACKCGSHDMYLHDMHMHHTGLTLERFRVSIYFYCPFCERRWVIPVKESKVRLFVKQKHINVAKEA